MNGTPEIQIFSGSAHRQLALAIAAYLGRPLGDATVSSFPDGETFVKINDNVRGRAGFIVHGDLEEVDVEDVAAHGMVLHFLDQGKLAGDAAALGDHELDEDVLADRVGEERRDLALLDLEVGGLVLVTVDHRRDEAAGAELLDGIAADLGAGPGGKFDLFSHGIGRVCGFYECLRRNSELTDSPPWMRRIPSPSNSAMERTLTRSPDPVRTGTLSVVMSSLISEPSNR